MAKIHNSDYTQKSGKLNRKDNVIHRVRNGKEHVYSQQIEQTPSPATQLPKGVSLHIRTFAALSASEIYEILKARYTVFTEEQHIIYLDEDDVDYLATHIYFSRGPRVIAYARLFPDKPGKFLNTATYNLENTPQAFLVGRMLTIERGQGLGTRLLHSIVAEAKRQGAQLLRLHAQTQAVPFYEKCGFQTVGDVFTEADIPHILMEMPLS